MEISEDRLQQLLQEAASRGAVDALLNVARKPGLASKIRKANTKVIQVRNSALLQVLFRKLGFDPKMHSTTELFREAIEIGLSEAASEDESSPPKLARLVAVVDLETIKQIKQTGKMNNLVLTGLLCMALEGRNNDWLARRERAPAPE